MIKFQSLFLFLVVFSISTQTWAERDGEIFTATQLELYNSKNLSGFIATFHPDIQHIDMATGNTLSGLQNIEKTFKDLFDKNEWVKAEILDKFIYKDIVIHVERFSSSSEPEPVDYLIAHKIKDGLTHRLWFLRDLSGDNGEEIVQTQLQAYNNRDIERFLETYAKDVKIQNLTPPGLYQGIDIMRSGYTSYFETALGLNAEIKQRLIYGPIVIDQEYVTTDADDTPFEAIAIYHTKGDLIDHVWFIVPTLK